MIHDSIMQRVCCSQGASLSAVHESAPCTPWYTRPWETFWLLCIISLTLTLQTTLYKLHTKFAHVSCCFVVLYIAFSRKPNVIWPPSGPLHSSHPIPSHSPHIPHRHPPPWWGQENRLRQSPSEWQVVCSYVCSLGCSYACSLRCVSRRRRRRLEQQTCRCGFLRVIYLCVCSVHMKVLCLIDVQDLS